MVLPSLRRGDGVLQVAVEVEAPGAALAADPGLAGAAEGGLEVADEEAVDPDGARDQLRGDVFGARAVAYLSPEVLKPMVFGLLILVAVYTFVRKDFGVGEDRVQHGPRAAMISVGIGGSVGFYDGFFGPGTGSFLIFLLIRLLQMDFLRASVTATLIGAMLLYFLTVGPVRGFALFLGLSTVLDLIASYFFMRPAVVWLSRTRLATERPKTFGIPEPRALAAPQVARHSTPRRIQAVDLRPLAARARDDQTHHLPALFHDFNVRAARDCGWRCKRTRAAATCDPARCRARRAQGGNFDTLLAVKE